jgi:uncharacterized protein YdaU (DUF1376 family)
MSAKSKQLAYLSVFVNDYIAGTRSMTLAERGAYWDLLLFEWSRGGPLPNDPKQLAKMLGVQLRQFDDVWQSVREKFEEVPGGLVNARLERERAYAAAKREKASGKAAAAAAARWQGTVDALKKSTINDARSNAPSTKTGAPSTAASMLGAMLEQCPPSPSPSLPRTPDSEADSARRRARSASPAGPLARANGAGIDETDPDVQRHRQEAAAIAERTAEAKAP